MPATDRTWFTITARATGPARLDIFAEIGAGGVSAGAFIAELRKIPAAAAIEMHINSPGGSAFDGVAIHNALKRHQGKVTAWVDGIAASAASLIVMAADRVVMPANAMLMIHNPMAGVLGDGDDLREMAGVLDKMVEAYAGSYAAKSGKPIEEMKALMAKEAWLTAAEAVALGLADEIEAEMDIAAAVTFDVSKLPNLPDALKALASPPVESPVRIAADPAAVVTLCVEAECAHLAASLIREGATLPEVEARVDSVGKIRGIVADAKVINPQIVADADALIRAGVSVQAAREQLWNAIVDQQSPEICSALSSDAGAGTKREREDASMQRAIDRVNARIPMAMPAPGGEG